MAASRVLIVGAGPTGLVLAWWLSRLGVPVRLVDKSPEAGTTSRAVAVQSRTLEFYRSTGLAKAVVDHGLPLAAANIWALGRQEGRVQFGELGKGLSPFPYMLIYPQDEHERLLLTRLEVAGVTVERPTELVGLESRAEKVVAHLRRADGVIEICEVDYVAGCDGARSFVRQALEIDFPGGTYGHLFYVADIEGAGPMMNRELHVSLDDADFLALFPLREDGRARLIGTVSGESEKKGDALTWADVNKRVLERTRLEVQRVNWFSTYHVHHRVASAFRVGRAFLLGDAAHIHSPVGGQGMNTGIGDAVNLSWKLAAVLQGRAGAPILDSYALERVPFARRLVRTTDKVFEFVSATGPIANRVRLDVAPRILGALFRSRTARGFLFRMVSQIGIRYRSSPLSEGHAGEVYGGDRLPWVTGSGGADNFEPLTALAWQAHVYGEATAALRTLCAARGLPLHTFPWDSGAKRAGLSRDALYLVRPDGYVALAAPGPVAAASFERYGDTRELRFAGP